MIPPRPAVEQARRPHAQQRAAHKQHGEIEIEDVEADYCGPELTAHQLPEPCEDVGLGDFLDWGVGLYGADCAYDETVRRPVTHSPTKRHHSAELRHERWHELLAALLGILLLGCPQLAPAGVGRCLDVHRQEGCRRIAPLQGVCFFARASGILPRYSP